MIPVLFDSGEREFLTNGLGRLADALTCSVTEERNGIFELEMTYPVSGIHYKDIQKERIIYAVPSDGKAEQPFRIYKITKPFNGVTTVCARHVSYQLSFVPVKADLTKATTAAQAFMLLKKDAIEPCNFDFWTDNTRTGAYTTPLPASLRSRLGGVAGSVLDNFGGEYEWDKWLVKLHAKRGRDTGKTIRYGKDLTDLKQEESIENTVTGVVPYWAKDNDGETQIVTAAPVYTENASMFPYRRTVVLDLSSEWQEAPSTSELRARAASYMAANDYGVPSVNISISFVALWQSEEYKSVASLERLNLCDTVSVEFPELHVSAKAKVIKTVYDVLKERYSSIEIGNARSTLSDNIASANARMESQEKSSRAFLESAIKHATKLISGGLGGHVVFGLNADGEPDEILVMDTEDKATAVNVLRINLNGIGFSTTGYQGPFTTAWTIDSRFYADFITAGTLNGNLIKAGIITDQKGLNYWNMETGEYRLSSDTMIGEKTFTEQYNSLLSEAQTNAEEAAGAAAETLNKSLTQKEIFDRLTNNGESEGIYMENGKLYVNGSYIKSGTITADLINAGIIKVKASGGAEEIDLGDTIKMTSAGIEVTTSWGNYIEIKPDIFNGISFTGDGDAGTGAAVGIARDGILVKNNSDKLLGNFVIQYPSTEIGYNRIRISDALYPSRYVTLSIDSSSNYTISTSGSMYCSGSKSRLVDTDDYGKRLLYSYETPSPMFGDVGEGVIADDGFSYISIDPILAETIATAQYQVFLQAYGTGECYVKERYPSYFIIAGSPGLKFGWELKAKQSDFTQKRLDQFYMPDAEQTSVDYAQEAVDHISEINKERTA
jgi:phage minor structural protein